VGRCYRITELRGEIKSLQENAEENKKMGFLKWGFLKKMAGEEYHFQIARLRTLSERRWEG